MEELIGIIVAVAVLIFKAVSKKMNDSADKPVRPVRPEPMRQYKTMEEVFPGVSYDYVGEAPEPKVVEAAQTKRKQKPAEILKTDEPAPEKKKKIDPKKLVVYSEIMNRKY